MMSSLPLSKMSTTVSSIRAFVSNPSRNSRPGSLTEGLDVLGLGCRVDRVLGVNPVFER